MAEIKVDCTGETCPVPLVETRKALRKAKEKADFVNEIKSEFLMNVTHDIRTPMNVINGSKT